MCIIGIHTFITFGPRNLLLRRKAEVCRKLDAVPNPAFCTTHPRIRMKLCIIYLSFCLSVCLSSTTPELTTLQESIHLEVVQEGALWVLKNKAEISVKENRILCMNAGGVVAVIASLVTNQYVYSQ